MPKEEVREAAEGLAEELEREHGVRSRWEGDVVTIKGAGVDGRMTFHDGLIDVSVRLGLLASMFEPVIRNEVQTYLDNHVT
jgi:putative polyhydroxyalkanoate system protein